MLKLDERAFSITAPHIWNQLPKEIKAATDTQLSLQRKIENAFLIGSLPAIKTHDLT